MKWISFTAGICLLIITQASCSRNETGNKLTSYRTQDQELIIYEKNGYPSKETVEKMYDEMAFHGATQAYLWATAILVNDAWRQANLNVAGPLDFVTYNTPEEKYNIITSNMNTPYMMAFPNLKKTGPLIIEVPAGPAGGILNDIEHRHIGNLGLAGRFKYLSDHHTS